jgi:hypothetical protein
MNEEELVRRLSQLREALTPTAAQTGRAWRELQYRLQEPARKLLSERLARSATGKVRLGDRKDLLLLLLYVRGRFGKIGEGIPGTTRILKLLFIAARELNVDALVRTPYRFVPYRFGPFAPDLYSDIEVLVGCGLVKREELDESGEPVIRRDETIDEGLEYNGLTTLYRLTRKGRPFAAALLAAALRRQPNVQAGLEVVKRECGSLSLRELLRYVYSRYPEYATESEILKKVLGAVPAQGPGLSEP